jgi:hypothetical protein
MHLLLLVVPLLENLKRCDDFVCTCLDTLLCYCRGSFVIAVFITSTCLVTLFTARMTRHNVKKKRIYLLTGVNAYNNNNNKSPLFL